MKRYWKFILLLTIIVLSIGVFYLKSTLATSNYPIYTIEKVSGDEKIVDSMVLLGSYYSDHRDRDVRLSLEGVEYLGEQSILKQLSGAQLDPQIKAMQKEYWGFTRGKVTDPVNYFTNDKYLAYSNMANERSYTGENNRYTFHIAVLNKETNKTHSFDMEMPNAKAFLYVSTASVQMVGDELKVITQNATGDYNNIEYYLYTFDIANKKLKSGEVLLSSPKSNANNVNLYLLDEMTIEHRSDNAFFYEITTKDLPATTEVDDDELEHGEEYVEEKIENLKLHVYDFNTGELKTEELPVSLYETDYQSLYSGNHIYFTKFTDQSTEIIRYNIETKEIEKVVEHDEYIEAMNVDQENLYIISLEGESRRVIVVDLESGNSLYEGKIVLQKDKNHTYNIRFYNVGFK